MATSDIETRLFINGEVRSLLLEQLHMVDNAYADQLEYSSSRPLTATSSN